MKIVLFLRTPPYVVLRCYQGHPGPFPLDLLFPALVASTLPTAWDQLCHTFSDRTVLASLRLFESPGKSLLQAVLSQGDYSA
jgi:hypothetical protein